MKIEPHIIATRPKAYRITKSGQTVSVAEIRMWPTTEGSLQMIDEERDYYDVPKRVLDRLDTQQGLDAGDIYTMSAERARAYYGMFRERAGAEIDAQVQALLEARNALDSHVPEALAHA